MNHTLDLQAHVARHPILCPSQVRAQEASPIADEVVRARDAFLDQYQRFHDFEHEVHDILNSLHDNITTQDQIARLAYPIVARERDNLRQALRRFKAAQAKSELWSSTQDAERRAA